MGEEGSLSQESYNIALCAIKEALKQCASLNNSAETDARPNNLVVHAICGSEEENQDSNTISKDKVPNPKLTSTNKIPKRAEARKEKASNENNAIKKGKVPLEAEVMSIGTQDNFHQMQELSNMRPAQFHNVMPAQFQNMVPAVFQNVMTTPFHNVASTNLHEKRIPR
ncbi:Protein FAR1-related sequence 4 [Vitis vinifera]|uniref:Protein FAR1-related sequence 4 n=1 Tax=Vitis vinifera TaxID=29760 RepID=A0A438CX49_VITVI|nr:Protein FAR1-related sequence 4 [Vitis vinifera]